MNRALTGLLKESSRSFYLTLRILPRRVRPQIGLAYLLARTADTIADTELVPLEQRLTALRALRGRIRGESGESLNFGVLARQQGSLAEQKLLEQVEQSLALLPRHVPEDARRIREVLDIITGGQELDLQRFAGASAENVVALPTVADLDDYAYRVAGCVGGFWTKICRARLFPAARLEDARLLADGVRFGKGLQLVNILRDLPADLRKGRCYLPLDQLTVAGLQPADLLQPANEKRFRALYDSHLDTAEAHLAAGWDYTNLIPFGFIRVRLACAWPILIGLKTIARLRAANVLDARQRVKISRSEVRRLMLRSVCGYPLPGVWRGLPGKLLRRP